MKYNNILLEDLTPEEKMQKWIDGTRGFNIAAASDSKLINNAKVLLKIYNKTHNKVALDKMQDVINAISARGLQSQASNLQGLLNSAQASNTNSNQAAWNDLANRLYSSVTRELNSLVNHDAKKLLNKDAAAIITSQSNTCFLNANNKYDILCGAFREIGNNVFEPIDKQMLEIRTESWVAKGLEQYYYVRMACVNAISSLQKFFNTKGDDLTSVSASRIFIKAYFDLTNFKNEINPNYRYNDTDTILVKFDYPLPNQVGLYNNSHTILHWKDVEYTATLEFVHGTYLPVSGKLDEVIKRIVSYIMINFKNN